MAIAGKVAITPGGEWSVDIAYDKLVVVTFGNNVYLSIKPSTGIEPTNEEYWMLLIENVTQEQYDNIINGTTTVGNANKLGGKGASEYALMDMFDSTKVITNADDAPLGVSIGSTDCTNNPFPFWTTFLTFSTGNISSYVQQVAIPWGRSHLTQYGIQARICDGGTWYDWQQFATTADLANYLPKSGGRIDVTDSVPLKLNNTANILSLLEFMGNGGRLGLLGFEGVDKPVFYDTTHAIHPLFHTGNKPSGSYTGNGSATARTISTGGVGNMIYIFCPNNGTQCIIGYYGGAEFVNSGGVPGIPSTDATFRDGVLTETTTHGALNVNAYTYYYQVL